MRCTSNNCIKRKSGAVTKIKNAKLLTFYNVTHHVPRLETWNYYHSMRLYERNRMVVVSSFCDHWMLNNSIKTYFNNFDTSKIHWFTDHLSFLNNWQINFFTLYFKLKLEVETFFFFYLVSSNIISFLSWYRIFFFYLVGFGIISFLDLKTVVFILFVGSGMGYMQWT